MPSVSVEEQQALSCTVDEYKRRGHFVRIFPSEDSWELYGYVQGFMQSMLSELKSMLGFWSNF